MAFAPHTNQDYAYGKDVPLIIGQFREVEHSHAFEYAERPVGLAPDFAPEATHIVYVGAGNTFRFARILKTVAHIITEVDDDAQPVWERWAIKQHIQYTTSWAVTERLNAPALAA